MRTIFLLGICLFLSVVGSKNGERLVYVVYYEDNACETHPVSILGLVVNDPTANYGGRSDDESCAREAVCSYLAESKQCQDLKHTKSGESTTVVEKGVIAQCDSTNHDYQSECHLIQGCVASSIFPHCKFRAMTASNLYQSPEYITNNETDLKEMKDASQMLFYTDSSCSNVVGIRGIVTGGHNLTITTDPSVSCETAMACIWNPSGPACQKEVVETTTWPIMTHTKNGGRDLQTCDKDGENCALVTDECTASPIPSCYYRWVSTPTLLANPGPYLGIVEEMAESASTSRPSSSATFNLKTGLLPVFALLSLGAFVSLI